MKKLRYLLFFVLLLFSFNVKAAECDSKEFTRLKDLAKKIEFDYDYKLVNDNAVFSINAVNLNSDLRALIIDDYYNNKYKEFKGSTEATLNGFRSGEKVIVTIKAFVPNACSGETVLTKTLKMPYYNIFYEEDFCMENDDFKYCKKLLNTNVSESEYNRQREKYLKDKEQEQPPIVEPTKDNTLLYIIIVGVVLVIVISTLLIMSIVKRRKRNRL